MNHLLTHLNPGTYCGLMAAFAMLGLIVLPLAEWRRGRRK